MKSSQITLDVKTKLRASKEVEEILDGHSRLCNWLYNQLLELAKKSRDSYIKNRDAAAGKLIYSDYALRDLVPQFKEQYPFLKNVHSSVLKNVAFRLSAAIKAHQKARQANQNRGWPEFRPWKNNWFSLLYDEPNKGFKVSGNKLVLSLGWGADRKRKSVELEIENTDGLNNCSIRTLRIVKQLDTLYAVFTVIKNIPTAKAITNAIALDPNHKNLAYGVATTGHAIKIEAPHFLKKADLRIDELKAKRDRCNKKAHKKEVIDASGNVVNHYYKPSRQWEKRNTTLNKAYQKRRDQTKTFLYTVANRMASQFDYIGIGNYAPQGGGITAKMRRAMNNRSLIGRLKTIMAHVALKSGKNFMIYDEAGTTRTCHACNYVVEGGIPPSIREWECAQCNTIHDRDENAAMNGLRRILRDLPTKRDGQQCPLVPSSGLVRVTERWFWRALPSGLETTLQGPSGGFAPQRQEIELKA